MLDKKAKAIADMRALHDSALEEERELTAEERESVERSEADIERYDTDMKQAQRADELAAEAAEYRAPEPAVTTTTDVQSFDEDAAFRGLWSGGGEYEADMNTQFRALALANGHVPTTYSQQVVIYERDFTPMLNADVVTIMPTPDGNAISIPTVTADPAYGGTRVAEAGTIGAFDMTPGTATLSAFKAAIINQWSAEVDIDNNIQLQDVIAFTTARELAQDINTWLTTGTGTVQPTGFLDGATNGGTASGTAAGTSFDTFFAPADVIDLKFSLAQPYRQRGIFMVATTAHAKLRKMRDSNGAWLYQNAPVLGQPDTFDGSPVYENAAMTAVASATQSVAFGDFKRYIVRRCPLRVDASIHYAFATDSLSLRTIERVDGVLTDAIAIKYLVSADT
jgi:HK97 family phage major capsid protein